MKSSVFRFLLALVLSWGARAVFAAAPKYVFVFIGDGMSMPQRMVAEEFARASGYGPLAMNALPYQCTTRTRSANELVTDSAAAATAIACGEKANNGALGVAPDGRRLESVAEVAHGKGMKVGIMTTVPIVHATPAGFYAHRASRGDVYRIALDLLASGFKYFAGAGVYDRYDDRSDGEYRGNVFDLARRQGYTLVRDRESLLSLGPGAGKVWGVFSDEALDFAIDGTTRYPQLADMVAKGIELLDGPQGFFIMAEGGKLDYAAHANDAATTLREVIAMDEAVKVADAFAGKHPDETLIVVTGDHETGGLAMGFSGTGYKFHVRLLARQKCATDTFSKRLRAALEKNDGLTFESYKPVVTENFGLIFDPKAAQTADDRLLVLDKGEVKDLEKAFRNDVAFVRAKKVETKKHDAPRRMKFAARVTRALSNHAGVGWSSGAHTALPTMTTARGCGAENFIGLLENTDIANRLKALLR